jgi:hypothetical protein
MRFAAITMNSLASSMFRALKVSIYARYWLVMRSMETS